MSELQWFSAVSTAEQINTLFATQLNDMRTGFWVLKKNQDFAFAQMTEKQTAPPDVEGATLIGILPPQTGADFGSKSFQQDYGTSASYMAGAMANGIASADLVIAMGQAGFLGCFGSGGLSLPQVEAAIEKVQGALGNQFPYAFNFLSNPYSPDYENALVELYLKHGVHIIEASAFIEPSLALAYFRASGLSEGAEGKVQSKHKIIAKVSRQEVASKFLLPIPQKQLDELLQSGKITEQQAALAKTIALADDITVEADSGGHTDNRPLVSLLPSMLSIRDRICKQQAYKKTVRIGAAGGISTPQSVLSAFAMGADYVVTGSLNQSCVESGTSTAVKELLAKAKMADVMMAPAADMFEMGVEVQVLKSGTRFPMVAKKLYELYRSHNSLAELPPKELQKLEAAAFKKSVDEVWQETRAFFAERDPETLRKAEQDPKKIMALVFRWYLGKSSMWAITGDAEQMINAQVWCGQAMGAFNDWVAGTPLEQADQRHAPDIAQLLLRGCAQLSRCFLLRSMGFELSNHAGADAAQLLN